jgi:hypothetical protein
MCGSTFETEKAAIFQQHDRSSFDQAKRTSPSVKCESAEMGANREREIPSRGCPSLDPAALLLILRCRELLTAKTNRNDPPRRASSTVEHFFRFLLEREFFG